MSRAKDSCPKCGDRTFISDETFALDENRPEVGIHATAWVNTCKNCGATSVHHESGKENKAPTTDEDRVIGVARAEINRIKADFKREFVKSKDFADLKKSNRYKEKLKQNKNLDDDILRSVSAKATQEVRYTGKWQ